MDPLLIVGVVILLGLLSKKANATGTTTPAGDSSSTTAADLFPIGQQDDSIDFGNYEPTGDTVNTGTPADSETSAWFTFSDGYRYRLTRPERKIDDILADVALYEREFDTEHVYMKSLDGGAMLPMTP